MIHDIEVAGDSESVILDLSVKEEKTVCSIKTGVNDFLDYIGIFVTLLAPALLGNVITCNVKYFFEPVSSGITHKFSNLEFIAAHF